MEQIPGQSAPKLYERKGFVETITVIPPIIVAAVAAWSNYIDPNKKNLGIVLICAVAWLFLGSIIKIVHAYSQDKKEKEKKSYDGLYGALHVLYSNIKNSGHDVGDLRATLHRVISDDKDNSLKEIEQALPYLGGENNGEGRKFSINHGIIGLAARTNKARSAMRSSDDYEAFLVELCEKWAYTPDAARKIKQDRMAWLAVPILNKNKAALAVVYLDSNKRDAFPTAIVERVIISCAGIASYISHRYSLQAISADAASRQVGAPQIEQVVDADNKNKTLEDKIFNLTAAGQESITSSADALNTIKSIQI